MANHPGKPEVRDDNGVEKSLGESRRMSCGWRTRR